MRNMQRKNRRNLPRQNQRNHHQKTRQQQTTLCLPTLPKETQIQGRTFRKAISPAPVAQPGRAIAS